MSSFWSCLWRSGMVVVWPFALISLNVHAFSGILKKLPQDVQKHIVADFLGDQKVSHLPLHAAQQHVLPPEVEQEREKRVKALSEEHASVMEIWEKFLMGCHAAPHCGNLDGPELSRDEDDALNRVELWNPHRRALIAGEALAHAAKPEKDLWTRLGMLYFSGRYAFAGTSTSSSSTSIRTNQLFDHLDVIKAGMDDEGTHTRRIATLLLGRLLPDALAEHIDLLKKALGDRDTGVRREALAVLGTLLPDARAEHIDLLKKALGDQSDEIRLDALRLLKKCEQRAGGLRAQEEP